MSQLLPMRKHLRRKNYDYSDGFYDHVIRDQADYLRIWQYIDTNPARWAEDCYFIGEAMPCVQLKSQS